MVQNEDQSLHTSPKKHSEQQVSTQGPEKNQADALANRTESQKRFDRGTDMDFFEMNSQNEHPDEGSSNKDVATNDGSVLETLDTAFHNVPGYSYSSGENFSGSNRVDYYEARSQSKSDTEEELDVRREMENDSNDER
jgi:hypothetical protein